MNLLHVSAGSSKGGQFAPKGGASGGGSKPSPTVKPAAKKVGAGHHGGGHHRTAAKATGAVPPASTLYFNTSRGHGTGYGQAHGDSRVRRLQRILNRLGLTDAHGKPLAVDGQFGPQTAQAVMAIQRRVGFPPNGHASLALMGAIAKYQKTHPTAHKPHKKRTAVHMLKLAKH